MQANEYTCLRGAPAHTRQAPNQRWSVPRQEITAMSHSHARQPASLPRAAAVQHPRRRARLSVGLVLASALASAALPVSAANAAELEGTWSGGGTVRFASGAE